MNDSPKHCGICKRVLDIPADPLSIDCGGDCWGCVGEIEADMVGRSPLYRYARSQKQVSALTGSIRLIVEIAVIQTSAMGRKRTLQQARSRSAAVVEATRECNKPTRESAAKT